MDGLKYYYILLPLVILISATFVNSVFGQTGVQLEALPLIPPDLPEGVDIKSCFIIMRAYSLEGETITWRCTDGTTITQFPDGTVESEWPDGTTITKLPDGTKITETPDGTKVTEKPDGTKITEKDGIKVTEKDGTKITETPDGTKVTEKPDGTKITEKDGIVETYDPISGTTITVYPDNTKVYKFRGGTTTTIHPDGTEVDVYDDKSTETRYPNGKVVRKLAGGTTEISEPGGTFIIIQPDGTKVTVKPDGTKITEKDGLKVTKTPNETIITEYPDGKTIAVYKDGSGYVKNADGTYDVFDPPEDSKAVTVTNEQPDIIFFDPKKCNETKYPDGKVTYTECPDGSEKTIYPKGRIVTVLDDGTTIIQYPDGITVWELADGRITTVWPDGTVMKEYPNGTVETKYPGGKTVTKYSNGVTSTKLPGGTEITVYDDRTVTEYPNQVIVTEFDDRTVTEYPNQVIVTEFDDRTVTEYTDGSQEIKWFDGTRMIISPEGHVTTLFDDEQASENGEQGLRDEPVEQVPTSVEQGKEVPTSVEQGKEVPTSVEQGKEVPSGEQGDFGVGDSESERYPVKEDLPDDYFEDLPDLPDSEFEDFPEEGLLLPEGSDSVVAPPIDDMLETDTQIIKGAKAAELHKKIIEKHPDAKIIEQEGKTVYELDDGTEMFVTNDGELGLEPDPSVKIIEYEDRTVYEDPDGTRTYITKDGEIGLEPGADEIKYEHGIVFEDPDGTDIYMHDDGEVGIYDGSQDLGERISQGPSGTPGSPGPVGEEGDVGPSAPQEPIKVEEYFDRTVFVYEDKTITAYDDGAKVTRDSHGLRLELPDGSIEITKPDGTHVIQRPNGYKVTTNPNGVKVTEYGTGTIRVDNPDGTYTVDFKNGNKWTGSILNNGEEVLTKEKADGRIITEYNDLTITELKDGTETWEWTDGTKTTHTADESHTVKPDKTTITLTKLENGNTRIVTQHPDGKMDIVNKTPDGKIYSPKYNIQKLPDGGETYEDDWRKITKDDQGRIVKEEYEPGYEKYDFGHRKILKITNVHIYEEGEPTVWKVINKLDDGSEIHRQPNLAIVEEVREDKTIRFGWDRDGRKTITTYDDGSIIIDHEKHGVIIIDNTGAFENPDGSEVNEQNTPQWMKENNEVKKLLDKGDISPKQYVDSANEYKEVKTKGEKPLLDPPRPFRLSPDEMRNLMDELEPGKDGVVSKERYPNGDVRIKYESGRIYEYSQGEETLHITDPETRTELWEKSTGEVIKQQDGWQYKTKDNGEQEVKRLASGTTVTIKQNGDIEKKWVNGDVKTLKPNGTVIMEYKNGAVETKDPNGKIVRTPAPKPLSPPPTTPQQDVPLQQRMLPAILPP